MMIGISQTLLARIAIVMIMIGFCAVLFFCGDWLMELQLSKDLKTGTIYRLTVGASMVGIFWLQGWLYNVSKLPGGDSGFLQIIYLLEGVVGVLLMFRSAFRARRKRER